MKHTGYLLLFSSFVTLSGCSNEADKIGGSGLIETTEVLVSAESSGRATAVNIDEGMTVAEGDTLLIIDPSYLELEIAAAEAGRKVAVSNLESARLKVNNAERARSYALSERDRLQRLLASGTTTQQQFDKVSFEYDNAELAYRTALANVNTIQSEIEKIDAEITRLMRRLKDCYPVSPLSGTVTQKYIEPGELLNPGKAIARIARLDTVWVKVYLPASDYARIRTGDTAHVDTEAGNQYYGYVSWTADEAEFTPKNVQTKESRSDLVYAVKVTIPNKDNLLKIGMPVFVTMEQK
ncbi:MAG: efflux RND transporter periplasmic adaptor subunit [candidate division Zixibacteria bacterium]|nr:efflux RND transporter periplasmic adaptor subunit [candidate division Zixibacteria bacterium]MDD5425602.1 efflux RND transporter periplasmic adaptor subunit [candidate division Zixibacteria bacterium]